MAEDRIRGAFVGLAAGDRIGGPTRMALCLASSLLDCKGFDKQHVAKSYLSWWEAEGFDTGPVVRRVFMKVKCKGMALQDAAAEYDVECGGLTAGCNPAHRIVPLALAPWIPDGGIRAAAISDASLTHAHRLGGAAAAGTALMCRALVRGMDWSAVFETLADAEDKEIRIAGRVAQDIRMLDRDGFAPSVLQAAVYFVSTSRSFSEALDRSLQFAGAPNYSPILVGSLGGARWGAHAVPERHLAHCGEVLGRVQTSVDAFAREWE